MTTHPDTTAARLLADAVLAAADPRVEPPAEVPAAARLHFLDACGVALAAAATGPVTGVTALAGRPERAGPCTVIGTGATAPAPLAALVNGTLTHSLEYDDTHVASVMHGSAVLAPAALAAAQERAAVEGTGAGGGARMLRGYALGWETLIRIGLAAPGTIQARGFQGSSAAGPFAAAVAAGVVHGVDAGALTHALGIAGSQAAGTFAFLRQGATVKAAQPGFAAQSGLLALDLARAGVTGPDGVFEGPTGFFELFAGDATGADRLAALAATVGTRWYLPEAAFKGYPCCHFIHPFVEALARVLDSGVAAADVAEVHCAVPEGQLPVIAEPWAAKRHPARANDARWSLPYALAAQLVDGDVRADHFRGGVRPDLLAAARLVTAEPWPDSGYPEVFPARVRVRTTDGATHEAHVEDVRGSARRPMGTDEVVAKFLANAALGGVADHAARAVADELLGAPDPDLGVLRLTAREHTTPGTSHREENDHG
ncbi:MmgE/PrpD family protein [Streptomyces sedi]|uniref:MmgE/PrpD family protein n=1 Tax=Streptomyces sedi TaxID=555059 RepID=A0A5C4V5M4_9ACTN|nr:MmgE/PrpD family protein [Streptomyces sedi]TNM31210.1 MmgE/PrpD family protein [Streptomyces sedi]